MDLAAMRHIHELERREPSPVERIALDQAAVIESTWKRHRKLHLEMSHKATQAAARVTVQGLLRDAAREQLAALQVLKAELEPECQDCSTAACYEESEDPDDGTPNRWCEECVPGAYDDDDQDQDQPEHAHHDELDNVTRPGCDA